MKNKTVYFVRFTQYDDCYKTCESYHREPKIFSTKKKAEKYINQELTNYIFQYINDYCLELSEKNAKYVLKDSNDKTLLNPEYVDDLDVLISLYKEACRGQYIDYLFDWKLHEVEVE